MYASHTTAQSIPLALPDPVRLILALACVLVIAQLIKWAMNRFEFNLVSGNLAVNVLTSVVAVLIAVRPEHLHSMATLSTVFVVACTAGGIYGAIASYKVRSTAPTQGAIFTALNSNAASSFATANGGNTTQPSLRPIQPERKAPIVTQPPLRSIQAERTETPVPSIREAPPVEPVYERQRGDEPAMKMKPSHVLSGNDPTQNSEFPIERDPSSLSWLAPRFAWRGERPRVIAPPSRRPARIGTRDANVTAPSRPSRTSC